ncbi:pollen-specific protein C13-like [Nymphaea colorata]|nr:pollen-specific protein C13-like [Nymphaea colorata]
MAGPKPTSAALVALFILSALAAPAHGLDRFVVQGRVYCDTCRFGFETKATTYIAGAKVRVECRDRATGQLTYGIAGVTDATGTYRIPVEEERPDEICEAILISSPQPGCTELEKGRERASILLTSNSGISSPTRYANSLGFIKDTPLPVCTQLSQLYEIEA